MEGLPPSVLVNSYSIAPDGIRGKGLEAGFSKTCRIDARIASAFVIGPDSRREAGGGGPDVPGIMPECHALSCPVGAPDSGREHGLWWSVRPVLKPSS